MSNVWIVVIGGLCRGLEAAEGPFASEQEAQDYAYVQRLEYPDSDQQWVPVPLNPPDPPNE